MRIRISFLATITALLWLLPEATAGAGPVDQIKDSLPPEAIGQLGSLRLRCHRDRRQGRDAASYLPLLSRPTCGFT